MDRRFRFKLPRGVVVGVLSSLGIASAILWCKLMGHTSGFYLPLVGLSTWANARVFWLVGIALAALACLVLPRTVHRMDAVQRFVIPLVAMVGATIFALAFRQDFFDQKLFAMLGVVVSGFGYFWFNSRFVLLLALTQGIACLAWAFSGAFVLRQVLLILMDAFIAVDHQVMLAIALPLAAIAFFALACRAARAGGSECSERSRCLGCGREGGGCPASRGILWGIPMLPLGRRMDVRSGRYLLVMVVAVGLLLSVARACSISGTWGGDHTRGLDVATAVPQVALYGLVIFGLVYVGIVRMAHEQDLSRFLVGVFIVLTGLLLSAFKTQVAFVPPVLLEALVSTNDPFALVLFWSTVGVALQSLSLAPNRLVGMAGTVYALPSIAWVFLVNNENAVSGAFVLTAVYVLFALLVVVFRAAPENAARRCVEADGGVARAPGADPLPAAGPAPLAAEGEGDVGGEDDGTALMVAIQERCEEIARQYSLSPREGDVLLLLAQGRTGSAICEGLGVAASTVKTHTQHIYAKLEVNDRQELMDMVLGLR